MVNAAAVLTGVEQPAWQVCASPKEFLEAQKKQAAAPPPPPPPAMGGKGPPIDPATGAPPQPWQQWVEDPEHPDGGMYM